MHPLFEMSSFFLYFERKNNPLTPSLSPEGREGKGEGWFGCLDIGNWKLFGPALAGLGFGYWNLACSVMDMVRVEFFKLAIAVSFL